MRIYNFASKLSWLMSKWHCLWQFQCCICMHVVAFWSHPYYLVLCADCMQCKLEKKYTVQCFCFLVLTMSCRLHFLSQSTKLYRCACAAGTVVQNTCFKCLQLSLWLCLKLALLEMLYPSVPVCIVYLILCIHVVQWVPKPFLNCCNIHQSMLVCQAGCFVEHRLGFDNAHLLTKVQV